MAAEKSSENKCRMRCVAGDDARCLDYRTRLYDPANDRNRVRSRYSVEHHSYESIECDHLPEKLQWTRRDATTTMIITSTGFDPINESNRIPFLQAN